MSSDYPSDLIQPCLLDRICDDHPQEKGEGRASRTISMSQFRAGVLRDLSWLLNTSAHRDVDTVTRHPEVADSVLNFGIRDVSGLVHSAIDIFEFRKHIESRLRVFEPRLNPDKLEVREVETTAREDEQKTLRFEITGELWARPFPESFYTLTEVDLETGQLSLRGAR